MSVKTLREAVERGLRKCRVEDAPVPLIAEHDIHHVAHMVTQEVAPLIDWESPTWGEPSHNVHVGTTDDLGDHGRHSDETEEQ